jgi:hypothetical protein
MATVNIGVTSAWTKVADDTHSELLVSWSTPVDAEFACTDADSSPLVRGHRLSYGEAINRSIIGTGYVWARLIYGSVPGVISMVVTKA